MAQAKKGAGPRSGDRLLKLNLPGQALVNPVYSTGTTEVTTKPRSSSAII
jgi:hypothetical protein